MKPFHDPVPDGQTGPFLRKVHKRRESTTEPGVQVLAYDERCKGCREGLLLKPRESKEEA